MGKGTFLMQEPENRWVRTDPTGTAAETQGEKLPCLGSNPRNHRQLQKRGDGPCFCTTARRLFMSCFSRRKCSSGKRDSESCIAHVQQYSDSKPTSLSHSPISRKPQEKEMDSVLEREINSSKSDWRGAAPGHSPGFSSCAVPGCACCDRK